MSKTSHLLSKQNSQQPKQFRGGEKKVMKKSLSLLVAIAMVFSMFATLVSAAETKTAGEKLQGYGIIKGTNEGLAEDAEWVRQDVTVLLSRLLGVEAKAAATANTHGFTDLDSKFYNGYVSWAKAEGYFTGHSATRFGTGDSITNQEFAAVLLRVLGVKDVPYAESLTKAVELKLVSADLSATDNAVRGEIYTALVTALDFEIDGKKLGTILGIAEYAITDVSVVGAKATNSKTVKVEFNQEIGTVLANDFVVKNKETDSVEVISTVAVSGKEATITLFDSLSKDKTYVVEVSGVTSKDGKATQAKAETAEFTYVKTAAASIALPKTIVAKGSNVDYVIKNAAGDDITLDFDLANVIEVSSSDENKVEVVNNYTLKSQSTGDYKGYSVVNVVLTIDEDTTFETGNTVIQVKDSVDVIDSIGKISFNSDFSKDAETSLFVKPVVTKQLFAQVLDADGNDIAAEKTFKSANPTVLVVDEEGFAHAVKAGSATVTVTAKYNDKTITKSVVITVKAEAKVSGIDVDNSSVKLVLGANDANGNQITETVKVTVKDQYGDALKKAGEIVSVKASKNDVVKGITTVAYDDNTNADGVVELVLDIDAAALAKGDANSTVITVQAGTFKKTISVSLVKKAALAGYVVELSATKLDLNSEAAPADKNAIKDAVSATVKVYQKDVNGNKIGEVVTDATNEVKVVDEKTGGAVDVAADKVTITRNEVGTEKVTVYVNNVKVGTYTITVVNTEKHLTKVVQTKNAITASGNLEEQLFGATKDGGAFVGYDQYGEKFLIDGDYTVYSSNKTVVVVDAAGVPSAGVSGTALLTIVTADSVFTITVKVN